VAKKIYKKGGKEKQKGKTDVVCKNLDIPKTAAIIQEVAKKAKC
jgi:hypothetical protein